MVSFSDSIAPIFAQRCVACHNARTAKGRLNLDSFAATLKGGESGLSFESGKADASTLVSLIEDGSMPKDADPLTADQIKLIKKWINTGAGLNAGVGVNDPLIAIVPKRPQPMPPKGVSRPGARHRGRLQPRRQTAGQFGLSRGNSLESRRRKNGPPDHQHRRAGL